MPAETTNTARLEAFSDGVFAIAITLLVLNLKVPELEPGPLTDTELRGKLLRQWPAYVGFLTSFITILIIWVNHHYLFRYVRASSRSLMFVNGLLLLVVTIIPFPTSLVSAYVLTPGAPSAALVYCGTYLALSLVFNLLWYSIRKLGLLKTNGTERINFGGIRRGYLTGPVLYGFATVMAPFFPLMSVVICLILAVFFAVMSYER